MSELIKELHFNIVQPRYGKVVSFSINRDERLFCGLLHSLIESEKITGENQTIKCGINYFPYLYLGMNLAVVFTKANERTITEKEFIINTVSNIIGQEWKN